MNSFKILSAAFLLMLIGIASALSYFPERDSLVGSCPQLKDNDTILGRTDFFSQEGLLPSLFVRGPVRQRPFLKIIRSKILCEATGYYKNTASSYTMIVEYQDQNRHGKEQVVVTVDCVRDEYNPDKEYSFFPKPHYRGRIPTHQGGLHNTARSRGESTLHERFLATFDTVKLTECGECRFFGSDQDYDKVTGCGG